MENETKDALGITEPSDQLVPSATPTADNKAPAKKPSRKLIFICGIIAAVCCILAVFVLPTLKKPSPPSVTIVSTLERVILNSELSSHTAIYNGITQVMNEKKPEDTDYYVSYEAQIKAGITLTDISLSADEETKSIYIFVPDVHITSNNVDITTLDFIFYNNKANTSTVSQAAYRACQEDVAKEIEKQAAILDCARKGAENILKALTEPIVEQMDAEYQVIIEWGDVK